MSIDNVVMCIPFPSPLLKNLDRDCLACKRRNSVSRQAYFALILYLPQVTVLLWVTIPGRGKTLQIAALFADNNSFLNMHIVRMHHPFNFCFASDSLKLDFPTSHYATDWLLGVKTNWAIQSLISFYLGCGYDVKKK